MKATTALLSLLLLLVAPGIVQAADDDGPLPVEWWSAAPFVLLLLAIAVLPLLVDHWWHKNRNKALVAVPLGAMTGAYLWTFGDAGVHALEHAMLEYFSFMVLLWSLYTISGGIVIEGDLQGSPVQNTVLLTVGVVLASFIGTTGASMLLIRPFLRMNHGRKYVKHLPIFFIFAVSNCGGLLTPLGDPPLFLGYIKGVDFFWTLQHLWRVWLVVNGILLVMFFVWDVLATRMEDPRQVAIPEARKPLRVRGLFGFVLLAGVIGAVFLKSALAGTQWEPYFIPEGLGILIGIVSILAAPRSLRQANNFTWGPIVEVGVLFVGIFAAMVPALELLKLHRESLNVSQPWQFFWLTGALSSFLDNAPTYVTFGTLAAGTSDFSVLMKPEYAAILAAISCGAVFMGANTYIGNGPNFMVKAIAEEDGYKMPSFFGYMLYSGFILLPIFGLVTFLFFRPV